MLIIQRRIITLKRTIQVPKTRKKYVGTYLGKYKFVKELPLLIQNQQICYSQLLFERSVKNIRYEMWIKEVSPIFKRNQFISNTNIMGWYKGECNLFFSTGVLSFVVCFLTIFFSNSRLSIVCGWSIFHALGMPCAFFNYIIYLDLYPCSFPV